MDTDVTLYLDGIARMDHRLMARGITILENQLSLADALLVQLKPNQNIPVIGVTGPPGAGKSTLVNALVETLAGRGKQVAILAIDPSSPFNKGSLLGDRIRMTRLYNHPNVFIRSMASRGALGGLTERTIEISDYLRTAEFDYIFIETVGVGQSEMDIVGLADLTLLILVPESGDAVQQVKSGIMEIADVFIINKADRPDAEKFARDLKKNIKMNRQTTPVISVVASKGKAIEQILPYLEKSVHPCDSQKLEMTTQKAWRLLQQKRMRDVDKDELKKIISTELRNPTFNLYRFIRDNF